MDTKRALLDRLGGGLKSEGFRTRVSEQALVRKGSETTDCVHVAFISQGGTLDFTIDVAVRYEDVEDLVNRATDVPRKLWSRTASLGAELGNIERGAFYRWEGLSSESLEEHASEGLETVRRVGLPFFDRFLARDEALRILLADDKNAWRYCPVHHARAIRAVAMLLVDSAPEERMADVVRAKLNFLRQRPSHEERLFRRFLDEVGLVHLVDAAQEGAGAG